MNGLLVMRNEDYDDDWGDGDNGYDKGLPIHACNATTPFFALFYCKIVCYCWRWAVKKEDGGGWWWWLEEDDKKRIQTKWNPHTRCYYTDDDEQVFIIASWMSRVDWWCDCGWIQMDGW